MNTLKTDIYEKLFHGCFFLLSLCRRICGQRKINLSISKQLISLHNYGLKYSLFIIMGKDGRRRCIIMFLNYTQTPLAEEDVICVLDSFDVCFTENAWKLPLQERMLANFHFSSLSTTDSISFDFLFPLFFVFSLSGATSMFLR